jgi:lipoprotein-anchoring transpeptidase ErfK/SrfK
MFPAHHWRVAVSAFAATFLCSTSGYADPLFMTDADPFPGSIFQQILPDPATPQQAIPDSSATQGATQGSTDEASDAVPQRLRRQVVAYDTREAPGTIVIDTPHTYLYYVLGQGRAIRYGIGVGRDGFTWSGVQPINRKQEWPDWTPPAEMIARQPYLPRFMAGGPGNPLGARAMYLGNSLYRIHGTNAPDTIGKRVSSGCIRLINEDAIDLYNRTPSGTKVVVLPDSRNHAPAEAARKPAPPVRAQEFAQERVSQLLRPPAPTVPSDPRASLSYGSSASRLY